MASSTNADPVGTALRRRGLRVSTSRRLIIQILLDAGTPLSAREISSGPNGSSIGLDLASVYRNLELLERHDLVDQIHLGQGPARYVLGGAGEREYLACQRCGDVVVIDPDELDELRTSVRERFGYEVTFAETPMVGLCRRCRPAA